MQNKVSDHHVTSGWDVHLDLLFFSLFFSNIIFSKMSRIEEKKKPKKNDIPIGWRADVIQYVRKSGNEYRRRG